MAENINLAIETDKPIFLCLSVGSVGSLCCVYSNSQVLSSNANWRDIVKNSIPVIYARYIRLYPLKWHNSPCTRMEIYGEPWPEGKISSQLIMNLLSILL